MRGDLEQQLRAESQNRTKKNKWVRYKRLMRGPGTVKVRGQDNDTTEGLQKTARNAGGERGPLTKAEVGETGGENTRGAPTRCRTSWMGDQRPQL